MHPSTVSNAPALQQGYIPYFYQIGLQYVYRTPQDWQRKGRPDDHATTYDFSSDRAASRHLDHPQTVEQIIERGYFSIPKGDSVTAIITDKVHTSWLGLDDVIQQVQQRRAIYDQNLYQLELNKCAAINAIYRHEGYNGTGSASSKQHYAKHKAIQKLYEEERNERVTFWKDVSRLRTTLPETAQLYLSAHRKRSALEQIGDARW